MTKHAARGSSATRSVSRLASFGHAVRGIGLLLRQRNAQIHLAVATLVCVSGWWLRLSASEWVALVLAMAVVLSAEALNTGLEIIVDLVSPQWHALARDAKDVAAAAVLISSAAAAVVGLIILVPAFLARFQ